MSKVAYSVISSIPRLILVAHLMPTQVFTIPPIPKNKARQMRPGRWLGQFATRQPTRPVSALICPGRLADPKLCPGKVALGSIGLRQRSVGRLRTGVDRQARRTVVVGIDTARYEHHDTLLRPDLQPAAADLDFRCWASCQHPNCGRPTRQSSGVAGSAMR